MSRVGSSVPRAPFVTGAVPTTRVLNMALPAGAIASTYLKKLGSVAVPMIWVGPVTVASFAGDVMAAVGAIVSGTVAFTSSVVDPMIPPRVAAIVVLPTAVPVATPALVIVATAGALLVHVTASVRG